MDFVNETRYPARLIRTVLDRRRIAASMVARVTFDLRDGALVPAEEQPWIVSPEPWDSPAGVPMEGDIALRKEAVDVHLFGTARAPAGKPAGSFELSVKVGDHLRRATVSGPRAWQKGAGGLAAPAPEPIESLPISMKHAYGGEAEFDGLKVAFPDNPEGQGFYLEEEQAEGGPLPQIEDAEAPVKEWSDRPVPAGFGFCPYPSATRLQAAVIVEEDEIKKITHRLFNTAFPAMIAPAAPPGTRVSVVGVSPDGPLELTVPELPLLARVELSDRRTERPLALEQIGIEADAGRVFLTYRYPFRYVTHPEELRRATLLQRRS